MAVDRKKLVGLIGLRTSSCEQPLVTTNIQDNYDINSKNKWNDI